MAEFKDILTRIDEAIEAFNKKIPASQRAMLEGIEEQLLRLDLKNGRIKTTVANLKIITSIKNKLLKIVLNEDYIQDVKNFAKAFTDVTNLQNEYWKSVEKTFKPSSILKEIKNQAVGDTVNKLTEAGIGTNISAQIEDILRTNITTGGAYKDLTAQLRESLTDTDKSPGVLSRYAKQITTDSINQFSRNYTQIVSSDLGFEFYAYQGTDIKTTRHFCDALTDFRYFHISQIAGLLQAKDLYYTDDDGKRKKVEINPKTELPYGMIPGTNAENFFIRAGGYNCRHAIRPVSERLVQTQDKSLYDKIIATPEYRAWKSIR